MKNYAQKLLIVLAVTLLSAVNSQLSSALAQGTAFTYQGQLQDSGGLANGSFNLKFTLFDTNVTGTAVAGPLTNSDVAVSNGLFTVTIDFGASPWNGETNWLEIAVETNGGGSFTKLSPRQQVTPTPYAITAENLGSGGLSGTYGGMVTLSNSANQFTGAFTGDGGALTNVNAATLGGLSATSFWQLGGNTITGSQFIGTLDNQPLDLYSDGVRAMRLVLRTDSSGQYSNAPNVIGGSSINGATTTGFVGVTIAGGGGNSTNGTPNPNLVGADFGTISGGLSNNVFSGGTYASIGGGQGNGANNLYATIGGGYQNMVSGPIATVSGGEQNSASSFGSTVGGGGANISSNYFSTVAGGLNNTAGGTNLGYTTIGGGYLNVVIGDYSTIGGGYGNIVNGAGSFIGGGGYDEFGASANEVDAEASVIGGGSGNIIYPGAGWSSIGGGFFNFVLNQDATVAGGDDNLASGIGSFIGGGGADNTGLFGNTVQADAASIVGGFGNIIPVGARYASIGGGAYNTNRGFAATLGGGYGNVATGSYAVIGGGETNEAEGDYAATAGGEFNGANGKYSMVPGGNSNFAQGDYSFAAGFGSTAQYQGSFVWNDSNTAAKFEDGGPNQFVVGATGGFYFFTSTAFAGAQLTPGATSWTTISDRNVKKNFQPVDTVAVLNKLATIPIEQWNYKWEKDSDTPNIGPMAQDFKAAFYPGRDDKGISTLEFDGVELAAIQGLNKKLDEKDAEIADLKARLEKLEQLIESQKGDKP